MLRSFLARNAVKRAYRALGAGDASVALSAFRPDGRFFFAGDHSWAMDTTDADERRHWFERFAAMRPNLQVRDLLVAGPPWRMRACVVFDDEFGPAAGEPTYRNHGVQYVQLRWGRIAYDEVNLDTQKVAALDGAAPGVPNR